MDWQTTANISTSVTMIVAIPATAFVLFQLLEMKRSSKLSAFIAVVDFLQEQHVREARRILIALAGKDLGTWTKHQIDAADLALRKYNAVAIMVQNRLVPATFVLPEWGNSLIRCWRAGQPLIAQYRIERGAGYWQQMEGLYNLAVVNESGTNGRLA